MPPTVFHGQLPGGSARSTECDTCRGVGSSQQKRADVFFCFCKFVLFFSLFCFIFFSFLLFNEFMLPFFFVCCLGALGCKVLGVVGCLKYIFCLEVLCVF